MRIVYAAVAAACLLTASVAAAAQNQTIVGYQNLLLGMTIEDALAAEPRATRSSTCAQSYCLEYFDRQFLGTGFDVLAGFGEADSLENIELTAVLNGGGSVRCADFFRGTVKDLTRKHGAPDSLSGAAATWQDTAAVITVTAGCASGKDSTLLIDISRLQP